MAKIYKKMGQSSSCDTQLTDWTKYFFCQEDTAEVLRCPLESKRSDPGVGYTTIADLLLSFREIGCLSLSVNLSWLDEGNGIAASLNQHKAKWHESCRLNYNKTQLRQAERNKRPIEDVYMVDIPDSTPPQKFTRRRSDQVGPSSIIRLCFFCGKPVSSNKAIQWKACFVRI